MKILMASHYFGSHGGGVEIVAENLFRQWTAAGHEVVWMAGDSTPPPLPEGKSRVVALPVFNFVEKRTGIPFPIPTFGALRQISAEAGSADLLIIHDCLYLTNIAAFLRAWSRQIATLAVQHIGSIPYNNRFVDILLKLGNLVFTRPMLSHASQVVFISDTTRKNFATVRFTRDPAVIFNGVDADLYRCLVPGETKSELRKTYNLPADGVVILFVGRFVEKKGLSALKTMISLRPAYTWVFVGWGPLNPDSWNAPNVRVFSGIKGESIAALYRASDLLVLPSVGEGFPLVIQEALASGLPVVCSLETLSADPELRTIATGASVDLQNDGQTAEATLSAIDNVLTSDRGADRYAQQRRAFAIDRYSWQRSAARYLELASDLLSKGHPKKAAIAASENASR